MNGSSRASFSSALHLFLALCPILFSPFSPTFTMWRIKAKCHRYSLYLKIIQIVQILDCSFDVSKFTTRRKSAYSNLNYSPAGCYLNRTVTDPFPQKLDTQSGHRLLPVHHVPHPRATSLSFHVLVLKQVSFNVSTSLLSLSLCQQRQAPVYTCSPSAVIHVQQSQSHKIPD